MSAINLENLIEEQFVLDKTPKKNQAAILKNAAMFQKALDRHLSARADSVKAATDALEITAFFLPLEEVKKAEAFFDSHPSGIRLIIERTSEGARYKHEALDPGEMVEAEPQIPNPFDTLPADIPKAEEKEPEPAPPVTATVKRNLSDFHILLPLNRPVIPAVVTSILGQWKATLPPDSLEHLAAFDLQNDTLIHHARNQLSMRFLASGKEWSYWMDGDVLAPNGNAGWFKRWSQTKASAEFAGMIAIAQLTSHKDKKIVSGVYCQRNVTRKLVAPDSVITEHGETIKAGPRKALIASPWVPFGCVAVHRDVFASIQSAFPELAPKKEGDPWNFFGADLESASEDVAFCKRAKAAGHQAYFDLGIQCSHIGNFAFNP